MWYPEAEMSNEEMYLQLKGLLEQGKLIELQWDCGGDEAIVYLTKESADINVSHEKLVNSMILYILNFLNLPDSGEFSMKGKGRLILEGENIVIDCESIMHGYEHYDPDTNEAYYKATNEIEPSFSGKRVMFKS